MFKERFGKFISDNYVIKEYGNASSILKYDFKEEFENIQETLGKFTLKKSDIIKGGGGKSNIPKILEKPLTENKWSKKQFKIKIFVNDNEEKFELHEIDCFKNKIGLEIEWNNKTEFYDRDLNNFRILHQLKALTLGVIITRDNDLNDIFKELKIIGKYGSSTTILSKLLFKISSGALGGCPLLVFGITKKLYRSGE